MSFHDFLRNVLIMVPLNRSEKSLECEITLMMILKPDACSEEECSTISWQ